MVESPCPETPVATGLQLVTGEIQRRFNQMHRSIVIHFGHAAHVGGHLEHYKRGPHDQLQQLLQYGFSLKSPG
jgi:hypothetical protein